jgi:phosphopantothenoylcysteine decarboxylase/phosphopantothenate--cysteine ligase
VSARILVGVSGGIAAYKAASLVSALVQRGDEVDVVMTDAAQRFITPLTFAALTHRAVHVSTWDAPEAISHISLARWAQIVAIVPATADVIAKVAVGIADDLLTSIALATRVPILIAPAMNDAMYENPVTQANIGHLRARGVEFVDPEVGFLAEREVGVGRLAAERAILAAIDAVLGRPHDLEGERVLITAGPTREAIDPVRFISNASSGTMGIELAREAIARGATVDLILGPTLVEPPAGANVVHVTTAQEMCDATLAAAVGADVTIAAAAVSDWRPTEQYDYKIKKAGEVEAVAFERTPDILKTLGERKNGTFLVGFAAETERFEENARVKLSSKHLDAIAVNDVSKRGVGFGTGDNELVVLWGSSERRVLERADKRELARSVWDTLLEIRKARR